MVRPADAKLTPDVAAEICERTGSAAVVEGSITSLGSEYVLGLRARNCRTGDILDEEQAPAAKKEEVFKALGQMANRFRTRAGESLPERGKGTESASRGDHAFPRGLEVLQRGHEGATAQRHRQRKPSHLLKRAIEIDPQFAMAYADLGRLYASLGESELAAAEYSQGL